VRAPFATLLILIGIFAVTLPASAVDAEKVPKAPVPLYPVSAKTFVSMALVWIGTDDDDKTEYLIISKDGTVEAGVRTEEVGLKKMNFKLSEATFRALLAAINRAELRENTRANGAGEDALLTVSLTTTDGSVWNWYAHKKGQVAEIIGRFAKENLWPDIYRHISALKLTRVPVKPSPTMPLPEVTTRGEVRR
jgi:hypothetical protein